MGPLYGSFQRPQNLIFLIIGPPKMVAPDFGKPHAAPFVWGVHIGGSRIHGFGSGFVVKFRARIRALGLGFQDLGLPGTSKLAA